MIVAEQVQKSMEGKHPNFRGHVVTGPTGLPPRDATSNHDIPERSRLIGGKRQNVRGHVLAAKLAVELLDAPIRHQGNSNSTASFCRRDAAQPARQGLRSGARAHDLHLEVVRGCHTSPPLKVSYALTICCTSLWRTTSDSSK